MKGIASIEVLILLLLVLGGVSLFAEHYFPSAKDRAVDMVNVIGALQAADKVGGAVEYVGRSPPGTSTRVFINLPAGASLSCRAGERKLRISVGDIDRDLEIPLACHEDYNLVGPLRGRIGIGRYGRSEVVIG